MFQQLFKLSLNICNQRIGQNFKLINYYRRFYFSTATQNIDQLKNQLRELNSKFNQIEEYNEKEKIMLNVIDIRKQLNTLLFPNKQVENKLYEGYRRDLFVIAELNFENNKPEECSKLLNEIMQGDFRNELIEYKDENQAFLKGLFVLHCISNLNKLSIAEQSAREAIQYLQYFIDNECPIYQASLENQSSNIDSLFEQEIEHIQNMVRHLVIYSKIYQERGKLIESIEQLQNAGTLLENTGHLFRQIFSNKIKIKTELKKEDIQNHFMNMLFDEAIIMKEIVKVGSQLNSFDNYKQMIENALIQFDYLIEQKFLNPSDHHYVDMLIEQFNHLFQTNGKVDEMKAIKNKLDEIAKNTKENIDDDYTLYTLIRYELFLNKYFDHDISKLNELMPKIEYIPKFLEFNKQRIQAQILKSYDNNAQILCKEQLNILKSFYDSSHQQYGETLLNLLELAIINQDYFSAKSYIVQLSSESYNITYIQDIEQIKQFQRLRVEFLERYNQKQSNEQLKKILLKIESIKFSQFLNLYKKNSVLADFYNLIGDTNLQKQKLNLCLYNLQKSGTFPKRYELIQNIKETIKKIN